MLSQHVDMATEGKSNSIFLISARISSLFTPGKKKKKKGKTVALNEFLGEEPSGAFVSFSTSHTSNWAEESEDINPDCNR